MISRSSGLRIAEDLVLLVVIGLSTVVDSGLDILETCSLLSEYAGITFPIEKFGRPSLNRFVRTALLSSTGSPAYGSDIEQSPGTWFE